MFMRTAYTISFQWYVAHNRTSAAPWSIIIHFVVAEAAAADEKMEGCCCYCCGKLVSGGEEKKRRRSLDGLFGLGTSSLLVTDVGCCNPHRSGTGSLIPHQSYEW